MEERVLELRAAVEKRVALVAEMEVVVVIVNDGDECNVCIAYNSHKSRALQQPLTFLYITLTKLLTLFQSNY